MPESGPWKIVTDPAARVFEERTKAMMIESMHPGIEVDIVKAESGFALILPMRIGHTELPTEEELRSLGDEVDPLRVVIGRHW